MTRDGWQPMPPKLYAVYETRKARAQALLDDPEEAVAAVAGDSFRMADEALALWGTIDALKQTAVAVCEERRVLRLAVEDAIQALAHLMKQSGKPDQAEIVSRMAQIVVPRLHHALAGEDPYSGARADDV